MVFTVREYYDLVRLLAEHPEWQLELRRLLISEDLQALPGIVRDLAEAQRRSEERLGRLEETVAALAEAQRRTEQKVAELAEAQRRSEERLSGVEERLSRLEETVAALAEAQRRSEERLGRLEEAVTALAEAEWRTEHAVAALFESYKRLEDRVGRLIGRSLEQEYREKAAAYFGRLLRRTRVVAREALDEMLEDSLSAEELNEVLLLDLVVRGQPRLRPEIPEVWLAVEVSAVVDREDVERAQRRAALLRQAGHRAVPVVAGERLAEGVEEEAGAALAVVLQNGRVGGWEEALAAIGL